MYVCIYAQKYVNISGIVYKLLIYLSPQVSHKSYKFSAGSNGLSIHFE